MLAMAIENEVVQYVADHEDPRDGDGHRLVVRNGYLLARMIQTSMGPAAGPWLISNQHCLSEGVLAAGIGPTGF